MRDDMDKKEKIKLLSDVQSALENEDLKENVLSLPSGEFLWGHIQKSLNAVLEQLLENNNPETAKAISEVEEKAVKLAALFKEISSNPVVEVLQRINQNLSSPTPKQQTPVGNGTLTTTSPRTPSPVITATQEELQREWEEQQRQNAVPSRRRGGGAFGPY
jgi:hypothetical protein